MGLVPFSRFLDLGRKLFEKESDQIFWDFKQKAVLFEQQFATILHVFTFSNFKQDLTSHKQPIKISWRIDTRIGVKREGSGSPFFTQKEKSYTISGIEIPVEAKDLLDFGVHALLETIYNEWKKINLNMLPPGWSGNSLFGHFTIYPVDSASKWPDIESFLDVRYGLEKKVVALILVRNSEVSIEKVIDLVSRTSDYQLVLDDNSSDSTLQIIEKITPRYPGLIVRSKILGMSSSQDYISPLLNTRTTVWKVDGDEFWSPRHIPIIKKILRSQAWSESASLKIEGGELTVVDVDKEKAYGKIRDVTCFFNFENIVEWDQPNERLHGEERILKKGTKDQLTVKNSGVLMGHFPLLRMTADTQNDSVSPALLHHKSKRYQVSPEEIESIDLLEFDCVEQVSKTFK